MENILVSVCTITYNHENYIAQTIESVLFQKTNFNYVLVIGEDCSSDKTRDICISYKEKYPYKIKLILNEKNIGGLNNFINVLNNCQGKYIAICEGDDYWTDPYKLQKQVDFLEANPEYSISFHAAEHLNVNSGRTTIHRYKCKNGFRSFTAKDAIRKGGGFMTTNSMLFRTEFITHLPEWVIKAPAGDFSLTLFLGSKGRIGYVDTIMSVYRANVPGSWSSKSKSIKKLFIYIEITKMLWKFNYYTNNKFLFSILYKIIKRLFELLRKNWTGSISGY